MAAETLQVESHLSNLSQEVPRTLWQVVDVINGVIEETHYAQSYDIYAFDLYDPNLYTTAATIFVAGVLATASGIGGGGIFVAVLMLVANFTPHQAIPLSKALIFSGAIMSFILNVQKKDARGQRLIQIELVKNIVPMALGGTLLGVMLNVYTPRAILVLCLACLLTFLSFKLIRQGMSAYKAENIARESIVDFNREIAIKSTMNQSDTVSTAASSTGSDAGRAPVPQQMNVDQPDTYFQGRNTSVRSPYAIYRDIFILLITLSLVIACGSVRHMYEGIDSQFPNYLMGAGLVWCLGVCILFRQPFMSTAVGAGELGGTETVSASFPAMAFFAGICSGLMGIGGGLIFAPFLLMSGIEPSKAVVTSATCVIFTATSTTMQYIFLGRVMIYHAIFFGIVSFLSATFGAKLVTAIKKTGRNSYLVFLVAAAVGISCVLVGFKGIKFAQEDWGGVHFHLAFGYWMAQIAAATGWKLTTSMDDIMWLSPFLATTRNSLSATIGKLGIYIVVVQCVVLAASSVVWGSDYLTKVLAEQGHAVNIHAYLLLFSGSLLSCYALYLFREWYNEKFGNGGDDDDEEDDSKDFTTKRLIIVSFLGQLDELASFTTALLGGFFAPLSLSIGCLFACIMIASMTAGALKVKFIAEIILSVPVWAIIGTVSIYNLCNGISAVIYG